MSEHSERLRIIAVDLDHAALMVALSASLLKPPSEEVAMRWISPSSYGRTRRISGVSPMSDHSEKDNGALQEGGVSGFDMRNANADTVADMHHSEVVPMPNRSRSAVPREEGMGVHNHGPEEGPGLSCVEHRVGGALIGACLIRHERVCYTCKGDGNLPAEPSRVCFMCKGHGFTPSPEGDA